MMANQDGTSPDPDETDSPQPTNSSSVTATEAVIDLEQPPHGLADPSQEALKKRIQLFTEGLVKMAGPVLLALNMKKDDLNSKGNGFVRGSIAPLAMITLESGILLFVWLWLSSAELLTGVLKRIMYFTSKLLVHICVLLLVALASEILLLISMDAKICLPVLILLIVFYFPTILCCSVSMKRDEVRDSELYSAIQCDEKLENSVDFTASITTLVFLGLGRFAMEVGGDHLAGLALCSFVICGLGVFSTLYGTIPLPLTDNEDDNPVRRFVEYPNILLAAAVALMVIWIAWLRVIMKPWACLLVIPPLASLFAGAFKYLSSIQGGQQQPPPGSRQMEQEGNQEETTKPAPLELTKVTFAGFLLVAVPSSSDGSISSYTQAFILLTAAAVISGLLRRILTHRSNPSPALVRATDVASSFAHLCIALAAAMVPFAPLVTKARYDVPCPPHM